MARLKENFGMPNLTTLRLLPQGKSSTCRGAEKSIIILLKSIKSRFVYLSLGNPMIQLTSRSSHQSMLRKSVTTCRKWFSRLKILSGSVSFVVSTPSMIRNSTPIRLPRPITMPLKRVWLIIQQPWCAWQMPLARSILSSTRACSMLGLCCTTWLRLLSWRDQTRRSIQYEEISSAISPSSIVKLPRQSWNSASMILEKKWCYCAMSFSVIMACWSMEVQSVHALWRQRLSTWLTI